jgi:hypothetical protein
MAMLWLGGSLRRNTIEQGSLRVQWDDDGGGSASFTMLLLDGGAKPKPGQVAEIWAENGVDRLWAGPIEACPESQIGRGASALMAYAVTVGSFRKIARRRLALERYVSRTAGEIVRDLFRRYAPTLDTSLVHDGPIVAEWACNWTYPDDEAADLAKSIGFVYDVDEQKRVIFKPAEANPAPFSITHTSMNFEGLVVSTDRSQLRNTILVRGGHYPGEPVEETFTGDGVRANFQLTREPFEAGKSVLLSETFGGSELGGSWNQAGTRLITDSDQLQAFGGNQTWGANGAFSKALFDRKVNRRIECELTPDALGDFAIGWHDGMGYAKEDLAHGLLFEAGGAIAVQEGGVKTTLAGVTYQAGTNYRIRIVLKAEGATYWIQGGTFGAWGSRLWTMLRSSSAGSQTYLAAAPLIYRTGSVRVDNFIVRDAPVGVSVKIGSTELVTGIENLDEANGVDVIVAPKDRLVRFFGKAADGSGETIPAEGTTITVTYRPAVPVITRVSDPDSIAALIALEGGDGVYEYAPAPDPTLDSLEAARVAARKDLDLYANPEVSVTYRTREPGLRPWMLQSITARGLNGAYLVRSVTAEELGWDTAGKVLVEYTVTAGSKLLGVEDYLRSLIRQGKRIARATGGQIDDFTSPRDTLALSDVATMATSTEGVGADVVGTMRVGYVNLD